jgi:alpha-beta hydrolase superfamily lysophospholipase
LSVRAYQELIALVNSVSKDTWASHVPQSLPILLLSAEDDAVGGNGQGITEVFTLLDDRELCNLSKKQYPHGRHELLNGEERETVFSDIASWVHEVAEGVVTCRSFEGFPFGRPV